MSVRRSLVPLLAAVLCAAVPSVVATSATSADAATCIRPGSQNHSSGSGHGIKPGGTPIRNGMNESCGLVRTVGRSTLLYYHCWEINSAGHRWTEVRIDGTDVEGWVYNGNLDDGGSVATRSRCTNIGPAPK